MWHTESVLQTQKIQRQRSVFPKMTCWHSWKRSSSHKTQRQEQKQQQLQTWVIDTEKSSKQAGCQSLSQRCNTAHQRGPIFCNFTLALSNLFSKLVVFCWSVPMLCEHHLNVHCHLYDEALVERWEDGAIAPLPFRPLLNSAHVGRPAYDYHAIINLSSALRAVRLKRAF